MYSRYLKLCYARYDWIIDFSNGPMKTNDTLAFARYHDLPKRTETDRNGPERTETDRNGPKRTFVDTETDSPSTETDSLGTQTDRNGPKRTFVNTETDSVGTKS